MDAGALGATIDAMRGAGASLEVQEMAFIALQNGCYGDDELAVSRREVAVQGGALATVVDIMKRHGADAAQQAAWPTLHEAGVATLRVLVHNVQGARQQALDLGAEADWVRPIKPTKGATSSRSGLLRGFGTSRTKASLAKIKTND